MLYGREVRNGQAGSTAWSVQRRSGPSDWDMMVGSSSPYIFVPHDLKPQEGECWRDVRTRVTRPSGMQVDSHRQGREEERGEAGGASLRARPGTGGASPPRPARHQKGF